MPYSKLWKVVYFLYPPVLRVLEKVKVHNLRQDYYLGQLSTNYKIEELSSYLQSQGFEPAILAWKDPDELVSMRKVDQGIYQYHLRVYSDGEVRGHYEYSSEGNPWGHIFEKCFEARKEFFESLLEGKLQ